MHLIIGIDPLLVSAIFRKYGLNGQASSEIFPLEDLDYLLVGRDTACDLSFFDPLVEELHAELTKSEKDGKIVWSVKRVSSSRPMWVDGALQDEATLSVGSQIVVGPYTLISRNRKRKNINFRITESRDLSALSVQSLKRRIGEVDLLSDLSFTIFSGEVIAFIGPSGAGKTTLLNAINGVAPADTGDVTFNGHNFHKFSSMTNHLLVLFHKMISSYQNLLLKKVFSILENSDCIHPHQTKRFGSKLIEFFRN